ncbi:MAG: MFS transporter [Clostridia bacterium]|nr:MFS transporter [Clostridia bacterium]
MKLNYKRTILVGFAFFLISVFWQAYDSIIPKILTDKFGLNQFWSGIIMALDNVLAVFMLPLFGSLSDRCTSGKGRRTPFILIGTLAASLLFVGLSVTDNLQLSAIEPVAGVTDSADPAYREAMDNLYNAGVTVSAVKDGVKDKYTLPELFTAEEFAALEPGSADYQNIVIPARQAYAWQMTAENPVTLVFFMLLLFLVLVSMATFRSPAVALMPDVTPKPLRSKGNAIINLMGSAGGILVLVLGILFGTGKAANALMSYTVFFAVTAGIMLAALGIFLFTVKEPQWAKEAQEIWPDAPAEAEKNKPAAGKLSKEEKRSLFFILASVVLWFFGYNAVTSKYSVYAGQVLGLDFNLTLIVAQAAAILSYLPVGLISSRVGRKKTILAGIVMLGTAFLLASFMREGSNIWVMNALFALAGIGWATINVNSYPMVVELAKAGDVGKYTGYYYTASMSAQILTPVLSGVFLTTIGMTTLFPYAAIFVAGAAVTMLCVHHGDAKPDDERKSLLERLDVD